MSKHRSQCEVLSVFDTTSFGQELAERVADYLVSRGKIAHDHRDYCGAGLIFRDGAFLYGEVWDGYVESGQKEMSFRDRATFVDWLAGQSDETLCGREAGNPFILGNQRITRARLEGVLATHRLVTGLAGTAFATRYHQLCARFPPREGDRGGATEAEVLTILSGLGRVPTEHNWQIHPWPCPVFHFAWPVGAWAGSAEFYLVHLESIQFWCYFDRDGVRAGDNLAVLVYSAAEVSGPAIANLYMAQPVYRSTAELREVLTELFA
jgi:hypothetical protein